MPTSRDVRDKSATNLRRPIWPKFHNADFPKTSPDGEVSGKSALWNLGQRGRRQFVADVTGMSAWWNLAITQRTRANDEPALTMQPRMKQLPKTHAVAVAPCGIIWWLTFLDHIQGGPKSQPPNFWIWKVPQAVQRCSSSCSCWVVRRCSDPAAPGLAHRHNVKSSSREKAVEGILHFLGCAAGMCTRPSIILSGN